MIPLLYAAPLTIYSHYQLSSSFTCSIYLLLNLLQNLFVQWMEFSTVLVDATRSPLYQTSTGSVSNHPPKYSPPSSSSIHHL